MLTLTLIVTKVLLGLLLSSVLSFGFYLVSIPIIVSVLQPDVVNGVALTVLTMGTGAGIGSFIAWFERDRKLKAYLLLAALVIASGVADAYLGLLRGIELMPTHLPWQYGLPVLSEAIRGAVISANVPPLVWAVYKAMRNVRIREYLIKERR